MNSTANLQINLTGDAFTQIGKLQAEFAGLVQVIDRVDRSVDRTFTAIAQQIESIRLDTVVESARQAAECFAGPGIDFEQSMAAVSGVTGIVGAELKALGETARRTGLESGLGAGQAAEAFAILADQIEVDQVGMEGLRTLQAHAITLSQAAGIEMADAAGALAGTINQFGLQASEAERVINVLAAGSRYGAAEVAELSQSFQVAGTAAAMTGLSVEATAGALEVLGRSNLKGAEAGMALRNILLAMQAELGTDFGRNSLSEALDALKPRIKDATFLSKVFGTEHVAAAQFLIGHAAAVEEMTAAVTGTNVAQEQAAIRTQTTQAMMERCRARIQELKIGFFEVTGPLGGYVSILTEQAVTLSQLLPLMSLVVKGLKLDVLWKGIASVATKVFGKSARQAGKEAAGMLGVVGGASTLFTLYASTAVIAAGANKVIAGSIRMIGHAVKAIPLIGWILAIISLLVELISWLWENSRTFNEIVGGVWGVIKYVFGMIGDFFAGWWSALCEDIAAVGAFFTGLWETVTGFVGGVWNGIVGLFSTIGEFFAWVWNGITEFFGGLGGWLGDTVRAIWARVTGIFKGVIDWFKEIFGQVGEWFTGIFNKVAEKIGKVMAPMVKLVNKIFGGAKEAYDAGSKSGGEGFDERKKRESAEDDDTVPEPGQIDPDNDGPMVAGTGGKLRLGAVGTGRGFNGCTSTATDLNRIVPQLKGSTAYAAIASRLASVRINGMTAPAAGMPAMARAVVAIAMPLAMAATVPSRPITDRPGAGSEYGSNPSADRTIQMAKYCDTVVINIANADGKGYDQIENEVARTIRNIFDTHEA